MVRGAQAGGGLAYSLQAQPPCVGVFPGEDSFELHSVDLELEAVEKQIRDLQVKQAQLRQRKAALESSRTDAHLSQVNSRRPAQGRGPRPGFVHSGAGVPRSLDAAAAEDASQAPGEDLPPLRRHPFFEISTQNRFAPLRETECDTVIIGDSIVRHVRATGAKGKVHTRCLPGARVLDVSAQVPAILKKNIGAVVLHAGTNDIRLRQTEILKKDFRSLVELVRTTSPTTRIIVSGPLPTFQRGIESVLGSTVLMACTQAELEQQSSQTTSPGHYAPSDCCFETMLFVKSAIQIKLN
ncbi:hypothetical protein QTP70_002893 [Hemibagrus guttatus]|uniref:SGNH hydrolase-type esterase domain-containing protein n=1 Tax=Hemibagrus guttatus TaxID=175788 RepID=A0AAE0V6I9_9TELE|nr:hypothetical protein QTP70_002893 [Hemibagrus guttatus]